MTRNITLSADSNLIEEARRRAVMEHTSLNVAFRDWLFRYAHGKKTKTQYDSIMNELAYAKPGRKFTRDELNER